MSTSDSTSQFELRIIIANEYRYFIKVSLFDSNSRLVKPNYESKDEYTVILKKGLYTVRVEMNGEISDKVIILNSNKEYIVTNDRSYPSDINIIQPPQQFSSALFGGSNIITYRSSHEYYTYPSIDISQRDTFENKFIQVADNSSLFIFMRFPSINRYNDLKGKWSKSFYRDFEIINEYGEPIFNFDSVNGIEVNENDGWVAFNAMMASGIYYLVYHGIEPRQVPIYVFKNWHTQFFMTLGDEPLFGTIRIFISKNREFNPNEKNNKYIDILLNKLQNCDYSIDEELMESAADGKFESPMLGLVCSYVYFKSPQTKNDRLFRIISQNMQNVILKDNDESPDIRALNILAANHFDKANFKKTAVKGTPMFRIGFETILNASIEYRRLISKNSVNDFISESLYYDSPFNTFKPIPIYKKPKANSGKEISGEVSIAKNILPEYIIKNEELKIENGKEPGSKIDKFSLSIDDYLKPNVLDFIKNSDINSESSWVKISISDMVKENDKLTINDIANQLNLSGNTITRIFDDWKKSAGRQK